MRHGTAVITSLAVCAACGGKLVESSSDPSTGSTATTGTTTGTTTGGPIAGAGGSQVGTGGPIGTGGTQGMGGNAEPCGNVTCGAGLACCYSTCGSVCVNQGEACPLLECPVPIDASIGGAGGFMGEPPPLSSVASMKSNFGYYLKDSFFISGCAQKAGHDCITIQSCPNQNPADFEDKGSVVNETFPVGGTTGTAYLMSFKFNGIAEGKFYQGGSWAQATTDLATPGGTPPVVNEAGVANDTFYIGGTAIPSNYNVMRIRVLDPAGKELGRYYMNAYPQTSGAESHRTFLLSYAHTIEIIGGGMVEFHIEDSNCHMIDNCGPGNVSDTVCDGARNIPNEPNLVLPAQYTDVAKQSPTPVGSPAPVLVPLAVLNPITFAKQPWHAQISHLTVTKVVAK